MSFYNRERIRVRPSTSVATRISNLIDVDLNVLEDGSILVYDDTTKEWQSSTVLRNILIDEINIEGSTISSTGSDSTITFSSKTIIPNLYTDSTTSLADYISSNISVDTPLSKLYNTSTGITTISLDKPSGITTGTYGSSTSVPQISVDSFGRITSISDVVLTGSTAKSIITDDSGYTSPQYPAMVRVTSGEAEDIYASSSNLYFTPSTGELTCTDFNSLSDRRKKNNIQDIIEPTELINNLRGVTFTWKDSEADAIGFIAQEVEETLPQLVSQNPDTGLKSVSYSSIIPILVEALKHQQQELTELKNVVELLSLSSSNYQ